MTELHEALRQGRPPFLTHYLLYIHLLWLPGQVSAQIEQSTLPLPPHLEELLESTGNDSDEAEAVYSEWFRLLSNPIDLNTCSLAELGTLPFLSINQAQAIIDLRDRQGGFRDVSDVLRSPEITAPDLLKLRPFVTLSKPVENREDAWQAPPSSQKRTPSRTLIVQTVQRRLDLSRGHKLTFQEGGFEGAALAATVRFQHKANENAFLSFVLEKDAGERLAWRPGQHTYGFDHIAGAITFKKASFLRNVVLGSYMIEVGHGLLFARPFGASKDAFTRVLNKRLASRAIPYASRTEEGYLRGGAFTSRVSKTSSLLFFYSNRFRDASLRYPDYDTGGLGSRDSTRGITSISSTGLYRTNTERARRNVLHEKITGASLFYQSRSLLSLGLTAYQTRFNHPFLRSTQLANRHAFQGKILSGAALTIHGTHRTITYSGEWARSIPGGDAFLVGMSIAPTPYLKSFFIWRRYAANFSTFYGFSFGERRRQPRNETGYFLGLSLAPHPHWQWSVFFDQYTSLWPSMNSPRSARGSEAYIKAQYNPRSWLKSYVQYRLENKEVTQPSHFSPFHEIDALTIAYSHSIRVHLDYTFSDMLSTRSRLETRFARERGRVSRGIFILQDLKLSLTTSTSVRMRMALFDTQGSNTTIYAYEHDVAYRFTILPFTGRGVRNFILLKISIGKASGVQVKYGVTRFAIPTQRGSGNDSFSGNRVRDIHLQFIWRF